MNKLVTGNNNTYVEILLYFEKNEITRLDIVAKNVAAGSALILWYHWKDNVVLFKNVVNEPAAIERIWAPATQPVLLAL